MKRSAYITLVLSGAVSGALFTGCGGSSPGEVEERREDGQMLTNNTHVAGRGYYHAPYHSWHPLPYNSFQPGAGYYHGGNYTTTPHVSSISASRSPVSPSRSSGITRGGFGRTAGSHAIGG
jgi:hypothetical protein